MRYFLSVLVLFAILVLAGCQAEPIVDPTQPEMTSGPTEPLLTTQPILTGEPTLAPGQAETPAPGTGTPDRSPTRLPERFTPMATGIPVTGEVPGEILDNIRADLAQRTGATFPEMEVIRAQEMVWNDGSLGCAQPGQFYTQAIVNGYWVVLDVDGEEYDYRVSDRGTFFQCENPVLPVPPIGTPDA